MTVRELSQLYYLKREIELDKERLARLRQSALSHSSAVTGMPRGAKGGDRVASLAAEMADLTALIETKIVQCVYEKRRLERFIAQIPDSITRQVFTLRFVEGLSYNQIAVRLGGGNTYEGVKKRIFRYLKQENESCP